MRRRKSAEHINSNDIKDHEEEAAEFWTFSGSGDISAGIKSQKAESLSLSSRFPPNVSFDR